MGTPWKLLLLSVVLVAALTALLMMGPAEQRPGEPLTFYCAAGLRAPVEQVAEAYEAEYGITVRLEFGGSGTLLSALRARREGDLYLAADTTYTELAKEAGLVAETFPVARQRPVIAVPKGNPKGLRSVDDLLGAEVRVSLANPDAASIGRTTKTMLERSGAWPALEAAVTERGVFKPTVNDVANDVKIGAVDAGIVWDSTAALYPALEAVALPEGEAFVMDVTLGVLACSEQPTEALRFARYLGARDRGAPVFAELGFEAVPGDAWAERPELLYYAGGVNRVAIEDTLKAFSEREGVDITTVYNGCGILLGQIRKGGNPDVYHTCDITFMRGVEDRFQAPDPMSKTKIVILVKQGNPHGIAGLEDLKREGLQVGLCDETQSTLGALTAEILHDEGLYDGVLKNVVVTTPTADFLVSQLTVGKLDAAVVYEANTTFVRDETELVYLPMPRAQATQTYAAARETKYPQLAERLHAALRTGESAERFQHSGFDYLGPGDAVP